MSDIRTTTRRLTIEHYERLRSSRNGNPRFRFTFTDGTVADLQSDASYGYEVGNPGHRPGDTLDVTFTRSGRISYARSVPVVESDESVESCYAVTITNPGGDRALDRGEVERLLLAAAARNGYPGAAVSVVSA